MRDITEELSRATSVPRKLWDMENMMKDAGGYKHKDIQEEKKSMSNNTKKDIIKEALREFRQEEKETKKREAFQNTKLLMANYNDFKAHVKNAISEVGEINNAFKDIDISELDKDELYVLSIKRSKTKTMIMIAHIDSALCTLRNKQKKLHSLDKYKAFEKFYMQEKSHEKISEELNCSVSTTKRWINEMTRNLGIYLFGADGIIKS